MEHQVGPDLADQGVHRGTVPDVGTPVLGAGKDGHAICEAAAHADQAARASRRQLGHQRRADAARPAGHHDGRVTQSAGQLRLRQAQPALGDRQEARVFLRGPRLGGDQRLRQLAQLC
jgi:hypothetical protein